MNGEMRAHFAPEFDPELLCQRIVHNVEPEAGIAHGRSKQRRWRAVEIFERTILRPHEDFASIHGAEAAPANTRNLFIGAICTKADNPVAIHDVGQPTLFIFIMDFHFWLMPLAFMAGRHAPEMRIHIATVHLPALPELAIVDRIRRQGHIPRELLARFSTELLVLTYPTPAELTVLLESLWINALALAADATVSADDLDLGVAGVRTLGSVVTRLLLRQQALHGREVLPPVIFEAEVLDDDAGFGHSPNSGRANRCRIR